ncbi:MAG: PilZ domain-containing protein [Planctomyces sp.]|nr:PilZ domain-containing protein [Planctomyces sp.]
MSTDPWSRPSLEDLKSILDSFEKKQYIDLRDAERLSLSVPAEITTFRGNTVDAMTREVSRNGLGLVHRGSIQPGEVTVKMATEDRHYEYRVLIEWCIPVERGMFMSGGRFLRDEE